VTLKSVIRPAQLAALLPVLLTVLLPALAVPGVARAQPRQLGVGFYVPETRVDPYRRFAFISGVARHLSKSLGVPVVGYAYKRAADLKRELKARPRRLHFALLGGFFLAGNPSGQVIAAAELGPDRVSAWCLMARRKQDLMALRATTLQLPDLGGPVTELVQAGLLRGNIVVKKHFQIFRSPDLLSAVEALRLKQARIVFAPVDTKGLVPLLTRHLSAPLPGFVVLDRTIPAARVRKAAEAIRSLSVSAGVRVGWRAADRGPYRRFRALARRQRLRMVMLPPAVTRLKSQLFERHVVRYEIPALEPSFKIP
jgi:hypothetical protein